MRDQFIGRNADGRAVRIGVAMQIDEARRDQVSITRCARSGAMLASINSILPKRMPMSRLPERFWLGSITLALRINRSNFSFGPIAANGAPGIAASVASAAPD
jgi:hypothetical protein